jgi:hypothetical protein
LGEDKKSKSRKIKRVKAGKKGSKLSLNARLALIPVLHWYKIKSEREKDKKTLAL